MSLHVLTLRCLGLGRSPAALPLRRVRREGQDWCVADGWQDRLLGLDAPDWFALETDDRASRVKDGRGRTIWRMVVGDCALFVKVARPLSVVDRLKQVLVGSVAEREWRSAGGADRLGVPTARCLAVGVRIGAEPQSVLISQELTGAVDLAEAWHREVALAPGPRRRRVGQAIIEAVADLFAGAHQRGFIHRDAHPQNILLRPGQDGRFEAVWTDVLGARLTGKPASLRACSRTLAQIDQHFRQRATRTERLRFVYCYLSRRVASSGRKSAAPSLRPFLAMVARASADHRARLARQWDRRLRGKGKYFSTFQLGSNWRATVVLRLERRYLFPEPDQPDRSELQWRAILQPLVTQIRQGQLSPEVSESERLNVEVRRPASAVERVRWRLSGSPYRSTFERCHQARHRDVPHPLVLGFLEHRSGGLVDCAVLLSAAQERV